MAVRCDGCAERAGVISCDQCGALLCARCFGPFTGGACEACLGGNQPELPQQWPCIEDVAVKGGII